MTKDGVRCYRLQFGFFDPSSTRAGLEGVTAASTPGYLAAVDTIRCGDFETFTQLGQEVDDAIDTLLDTSDHPENENAQIVLVGHSRGGLSARAFLQSSSSNREAVIGLVTTGSPHRGSRVGRIYNWLDTHRRGAAGTDEDDWEVVDQLKDKIDVRRPVIQDVADVSAAIASLTAGAGSLPRIRYGQIAYSGANLGFLARVGPVDYTIFDVGGVNFGEQLSSAAETFILDAGHVPSDYPGDGLIPVADQKFQSLVSSFEMFVSYTVSGVAVLHTEEPAQHADIRSALQDIAPTWFPAPAP
jgi:pimeloyl-ACP methyl ester carboxylesterase